MGKLAGPFCIPETNPVSKKMFIFSTLTASVRYCATQPGGGDVLVPTEGILIQGGANVINKNLITPRGAIITEVSAEQFAQLEADPVFKLHRENGFITVSAHNEDGEKVASRDLKAADESAPLTPGDFQADDSKEPSTAKPSRKA